MYRLRDDVNVWINQTKASKTIGITQATLSNIFNKKVLCRKVVAYSITKYIHPEAELEDYFVKVK